MAFTFSIDGSKIDVLTGTGTLAQLQSEANAITSGCFTNPSGQIYQVNGNRELEISSGVTVTTTDGDTLQWDLTANKFPVLDVATGGILNLTQNTTIIGDVNQTYQAYIYFYGEVNCNGTSGNEVIFEYHRSIYMYCYGLSGAMDWDYVIIRNNVLSSGYNLYFQPDLQSFNDQLYTHTFNNITIQGGPTASVNNGYIWFDSGNYRNFTFTDFTVTDGNVILAYGTTNLKLENWDISSMVLEPRPYGNGGVRGVAHYDPVAATPVGDYSFNQGKFTFKNCTFDANDGGVYTGGICNHQSCVLYDGCTFENATYGVYANRGIAMYTGTTTFNSITTANRLWNGGGTHLHARKLTLNVQDSGASPIADASVTIRQKQGRECWACKTDSNGDVLDALGDPIVLVEREETSTGVFSEWSDGTGDQIHVIEVFKDGYNYHSEEIAMTEDKTVTVTLAAATSNATVISNATLYGANIY